MKKSILIRTLLAIVAMAAIGWLAQPAYAQRGGGHGGGGGGGFHGGGGGFHGGGFGGGGFHGGTGFSGGGRGFHGGGFSGGRGGWGGRGGGWGGGGWGGRGWGGRGWGWGGRGWGWGGGWGYGWGWPWWGWGWGYPYGYYGYYSPYYSYPYDDYDYDYPYVYPGDPDNGYDDPPPADRGRRPQGPPNANGPARSWRPAPPSGGAGNVNYPESNGAAYGGQAPVRSVDRMFVASPSTYRVMRRTAEQAGAHSDATVRPEVQRARQRLQQMPPYAREREIETRYTQFSEEEKELLRNGD